jgi:hypothetical protein
MKDSKDKLKRAFAGGRVSAIAVVVLVLLLVFMVLNFLGVFPSTNLRNKPHIKSGIDNLDDMPPIVVEENEFTLLHVDSAAMQNIQTVYVIPGGGSSDGNYPEWTKRRVVAAHQDYMRNHHRSNSAIFLALSAGSLNAANAQEKDKRIVFESQHTIRHLLKLGVSRRIVFGDTFSWDTVTNAVVLRMFVDGVQVYRAMNEGNFMLPPPAKAASPEASAVADTPPPADGANTAPTTPTPTALLLKPLVIEVFISDFHADRVRAAFDWVLNLTPKVASIELRINTVNSRGIDWGSQLDYQHRVRHEAEGVKKIEENRQNIKTLAELHAFLMLGGHQGLYKYLHSGYEKSKGAGW